MKYKKKIIKIILATSLSLFAINYIFFYQWNNKTTLIEKNDFIDNKMVKTKFELKQCEVAPYFAQLKQETGQDALINLEKLSFNRYSFPRELKKKIIAYREILTTGQNLFSTDINMDYFYIDVFGVASYYELSTHSKENYATYIPLVSPTVQKLYKDIYREKFQPLGNYIYFSDFEMACNSLALSYPFLLGNDKKTYINIHYLHSNPFFDGTYYNHDVKDTTSSSFNITVNHKELFVCNDKAVLKESAKNITNRYMPPNKVLHEYPVVSIGDVKYIDMEIVNGLYDYDYNQTISLIVQNSRKKDKIHGARDFMVQNFSVYIWKYHILDADYYYKSYIKIGKK